MTLWTNKSVQAFAKGKDPVEAMLRYVRSLVFEAIEAGWTGPPYDPIAFADYLKLKVSPCADVPDARTVPGGAGKQSVRIEFNPNRPKRRIRYSLAHEIAHTFFPDCSEKVRHRGFHSGSGSDDWQLETLCNIAAAEILMPVAPMLDDTLRSIDIDSVLELRRKYDVSIEAILIRISHLAQDQVLIFVASNHAKGAHSNYLIDYSIGSRSWQTRLRSGARIPRESAVAECTAIGYTAKGRERWPNIQSPVFVECVGLPPYPGRIIPRVAGLVKMEIAENVRRAQLDYLRGDALSPRGSGPRIIAHIVNDRTPSWGGNGFAAALRRRFPEVQESFREWAKDRKERFALGNIHIAEIEGDLWAVQMVAQAGYGRSTKPRIRYQRLQECLDSLAQFAIDKSASIHMPRIGVGHARGQWPVIEDLIYETLISRCIPVSVYDLPVDRHDRDQDPQHALALA